MSFKVGFDHMTGRHVVSFDQNLNLCMSLCADTSHKRMFVRMHRDSSIGTEIRLKVFLGHKTVMVKKQKIGENATANLDP